jgi:MFS family permease
LIAGSLVGLAGTNMPSSPALLAGSALAGFGLGAGFLGIMRTVMPLAEPHQRAGLMAAFYLESYLAMSLPAVAAGYAAQSIGLLATANLFGVAVVLLALAAVLLTALRKRRTAWAEVPPAA